MTGEFNSKFLSNCGCIHNKITERFVREWYGAVSVLCNLNDCFSFKLFFWSGDFLSATALFDDFTTVYDSRMFLLYDDGK